MIQLEKSFTGLEKSLSGEYQDFIDFFLEFFKKSSRFKGKTSDSEPATPIVRRISVDATQPESKKSWYGTEEIKDDLIRLIEIAKNDELYRVDYAEITKAVLEVGKSREVISDNLDDFLVAVKKEYLDLLSEFKASISSKAQLSLMDSRQQKAIICVGKAIEHARLAHIQYNSLYLETQTKLSKIQESLKEADGKLKEADEKLNDYQTKIDEFSKKQTSIYTDFIAILGVFSSFVFVMFGGFSALSSTIETIGQANISMAKVVFISSVLIGFLITVLYSLIYWISLIIDKQLVYKTCECKTRCRNPIHLISKHRFYLFIIVFCLLFAGISTYFILKGTY